MVYRIEPTFLVIEMSHRVFSEQNIVVGWINAITFLWKWISNICTLKESRLHRHIRQPRERFK